jgi:hypothetical protein
MGAFSVSLESEERLAVVSPDLVFPGLLELVSPFGRRFVAQICTEGSQRCHVHCVDAEALFSLS